MESQDQIPQERGDQSVSLASDAILLSAPQSSQGCPTCGSEARAQSSELFAPSYVYALGRIEARFPTVGVEKEVAQAIGQADTKGLTDRQALRDTLESNRHLVRELCWVFNIAGLETYVLQPTDPGDYSLLMDSMRRSPSLLDIDVIIGIRGPLASPDRTGGLVVPVVRFDQIYSFDVNTLIAGIPRPDSTPAEEFRLAAEEIFFRILQIADNAGATDDHRALNYLAVRYPDIYNHTSAAFQRNQSLNAVEVRPSRLSTTRKIVDVIFSYSDRQTSITEKHFVRVDVSEKYPFLQTKLSPYYDR